MSALLRVACLAFVLPCVTEVGAQGATPDPLAAPACQAARDALQSALANTDGTLEARSARLSAARHLAAETCLGRQSEGRARSGAPQPPVSVRPAAALPSALVPSPTIAAPAPALVIPRPTVITTCDPAGCWDSEGRRLNNQGPLLVGPRGPCLQQGGLAACP